MKTDIVPAGERLECLWNDGAVLTEGDPQEIAADPRVKAVYLGYGDELAAEGRAHG